MNWPGPNWATTTMASDEILVHVSAPTSKKADDRYRNLVQLYHKFDIERKVHLRDPFPENDQNPNLPSSISTPIHCVSNSLPVEDEIAQTDTQAFSIVYETPVLKELNLVPNTRSPSSSSSKYLPQHSSDVDCISETPLVVKPLEIKLLTTSLEYRNSLTSSLGPYLNLQTGVGVPLAGESVHKNGQKAGLDISASCSPFISSHKVISTYPVTENTDQVLRALLAPPQPIFESYQTNSSGSKQSDSVPEQTEVPAFTDGQSTDLSSQVSPSRRILPPQSSFPTPSSPTTNAKQRDPPAPHITPFLAHLGTLLPLDQFYYACITCQNRPLRSNERGYWHLATHSWPGPDQFDFWTLLRRFVGEGRCGWGVWCDSDGSGEDEQTSEAVDSVAILESKWTATRSLESLTLGKVKVFCWGEVVAHVFLLLFVASRSRICRIGATWIDGSGKEVVTVGGMRMYKNEGA